jgi:hypothetical protein
MTKKHKMSTVHKDKVDTKLDQPPPSPSNITMTTSLEPQTTDSESCFKPVESSSSDAKEDSSISSKIVDDDENTDGAAPMEDSSKRFLPAYKKANAALTFPEKMMNLMKYVEERNQAEKEFCVSWLPEGKAFVIYNIKEFTSSVIPHFFKASKFCSFTRKLYRWGFRQLNRGIGPDEPIIFGNEYFQRDNADLMVNMRSITAASIRKRESDLLRHMLASKKRSLMSLDGASNAAYKDVKRINMLFNNTPFDQKQQNTSLTSAANAMASQQRLGSGFSTDLGHLDSHSLQMMYQSLTNKSVGSGESGNNPILSDAVPQMNSSSYNFNGGSSNAQDFNAMSSMHMSNNSSNGMMGGPTSNYMPQMNGHNGGGGMIEVNATCSRSNNARMNSSYGSNGYNGSINNNMFHSDSMYGSGSTNSRGNAGFNNGSSENTTRKNFFNGKHNIHANGAGHENGNYGNYTNMPMNMNINQHFFNRSATSGTAGGPDDLYFSGQQH